jgi:hypothetical protein
MDNPTELSKNPVEGRHTLYAFLATADEQDARLSAPLEEAPKLQRPLPDEALRMVALVEKADEWVPPADAAE